MSEAQRSRGEERVPTLGWLGGLLLLALLILVVTHFAEERDLARLVEESQPWWLVAAVVLQALTYLLAAAIWQRALVYQGVRQGLWSLVPVGLAKLFTDQAVPSAGLAGTLFVVRLLERRGVSRATAIATLLAGLLGFYVAYFVSTAAAVVIVWAEQELSAVLLVPAALVGLITVGMPLAVLTLRRRVTRGAPGWLTRVPGVRDAVTMLADSAGAPLVSRRLLLETTLLQLGIFLLDSLTLDAALRAVGNPTPTSVALASFVFASVVATLTWVPGGLGTFEGTCVAMLHLHGVPIHAGLAGTLLLRGLTFWLPMVPGFAMARWEVRHGGQQPLP